MPSIAHTSAPVSVWGAAASRSSAFWPHPSAAAIASAHPIDRKAHDSPRSSRRRAANAKPMGAAVQIARANRLNGIESTPVPRPKTSAASVGNSLRMAAIRNGFSWIQQQDGLDSCIREAALGYHLNEHEGQIKNEDEEHPEHHAHRDRDGSRSRTMHESAKPSETQLKPSRSESIGKLDQRLRLECRH